MNKKLARALRQKRRKNFDRYERDHSRRRELRDRLSRFAIDQIPTENLTGLGIRLAAEHERITCFWCGKRITKTALRAGNFYGLSTSKGGKYALCLEDVFTDETRSERSAESERVIRETNEAIVKHEFREFRDLFEGHALAGAA